jgi:Sulfotransferase family
MPVTSNEAPHGEFKGALLVRFQFLNKATRPPVQTSDPEEILERARALFCAEQSQDLRGVIAEKIDELQHYDIQAMERVVAILAWGRSGSLLLSSYLDGHADVLMLPEISGWKLYEFFERYRSMPWQDKLIAYPAFEPHLSRFFDGDFPISPAQYYAAVQAILAFYAPWPQEFLQSRRAFFLFMHIAYNLALGRGPVGSSPLIVYAQHEFSDEVAKQLVEDFPQTKFVHTIRDPLSSCSGMFRFIFGSLASNAPRTYILAPYWALVALTGNDRPHGGMESETRTIRFEDLHRDTTQVIRGLSDWLGLPYEPTLLDSTFNGTPWVVKRDGKAWSGGRSEQAKRSSADLSRKDQALLFALLYENFLDWDYPCPKIYGHLVVRCIVFGGLILLPMKMEIIAARAVFKRWIFPSLRKGNVLAAVNSLLGIGFYRLKIIGLLAPPFFRRCSSATSLLQIDPRRQPPEWRSDGPRAARSETKLN